MNITPYEGRFGKTRWWAYEFDGWTNKLTWRVHLWMSQDDPRYYEAMAIASRPCSKEELFKRAEELKAEIKGLFCLNSGLYGFNGMELELINDMLGMINYEEIIEFEQ